MPHHQPLSRRRVLSFTALLAAGHALTACAHSSSPADDNDKPLKLRFVNAAPTRSLDVATSGTLETARISAQVLEPLVRANIDTGEPEPCLATSWEFSDDRRTLTFHLRDGVHFHDGSPFAAEDVKTNVARWQHAAGDDTANAHIAFLQLFSPLNSPDGKTPLITDCTVEGSSVQFKLSRPSSSLLKALTQPAFGIACPRSLDANGKFTAQPVGTGAYTVAAHAEGKTELKRNESYWDEHPAVSDITFTTITNPAKRFYSILENQCDAYDLVGTMHYVDLARSGILVQPRDPYAITYISINLQHPVFQDVRVRQAVSYALNRPEIVKKHFPQGSHSATDFLPSLFMMKNDQTSFFYANNTAKAQRLLKQAGYRNEPVEFYYPTDVSLATMTSPESLYSSLSSALVKAGFNIVPKPVRWADGYLDKISASSKDRGLALTGFVGSYRDPNAFFSRVLATTSEVVKDSADSQAPATEKPAEPTSSPTPSSSTKATPEPPTVTYQQILTEIRTADQLKDPEERKEAYKNINLLVAQLMPAVPIAYPVSSVALGKRVGYFPLSATGISPLGRTQVHD
ncbi:ABC transporter substrate-binding protein [Rothia sp. LK2588]|uniref:ABC transporter substrate-binding protein n=1 Tax=Rothia sp. LK2588 TaxID=3114369 RepID=UPI0034CDB0CF